MRKQLVGLLGARRAALILGIASAVAGGLTWAQDKPLPPPYQMAGTNHLILGVVWDEAAVRKFLWTIAALAGLWVRGRRLSAAPFDRLGPIGA